MPKSILTTVVVIITATVLAAGVILLLQSGVLHSEDSRESDPIEELSFDWSEDLYYDFELTISSDIGKPVVVTGTNSFKSVESSKRYFSDVNSGKIIRGVQHENISYKCRRQSNIFPVFEPFSGVAAVDEHGILGVKKQEPRPVISIHLQRLEWIGIEPLPNEPNNVWTTSCQYLLVWEQSAEKSGISRIRDPNVELIFLNKINRVPINFDKKESRSLFRHRFANKVRLVNMIERETFEVISETEEQINIRKTHQTSTVGSKGIYSEYAGEFLFDKGKKCIRSGKYSGTTTFPFQGKTTEASFTLSFDRVDKQVVEQREVQKREFRERQKSIERQRDKTKSNRLDLYDPNK